MSFVDVVRYRLRAVLRPGAYARELDDELQHHLELEEIEARSAAGTPLSDDEARRRARRQFGNVTYSREERRMISGIGSFDSARQDIHFVLRLLKRRAGFAVVTIATIALGIGAATSIFSVADAVLFRPLALPAPSRLIAVWMVRPKWKTISGLSARWDRGVISLPVYRDWRAAQTSFDDVAVWTSESAMAGGADRAEEVAVIRASASLLPVLGVRPVLGAGFGEHDDAVGGAPVALVSYETWVARFASDPAAVGRVVQIDTTRYTIVGVLPPGLTLDRNATRAAYWLPAGQDPQAWLDRGAYAFHAIGRLKQSVSLSAATAESGRFFSASSGDNRVTGALLATLQDDQTRTVRRPLLILLAASGLLLLIACINVATLLLGEAASREDELRTRTALGAGRGRLVRQLLTESVVLAGAGAVCGVALAFVGTKLIVRSAPPWIPGLGDVHVDGRVLVVALIAAGATGLLFGLAPALSLTRPSDPFGGGVRLGIHNARGRRRSQRVLIAAEVALSMVLLVAAGLLVRSFDKMSNVGFRTAQLLVLHLHLPESSDSVRVRALYRDVLDRLKLMPEVASASATSIPPFSQGSSTGSFEVEGHPVAPGSPAPTGHRRITTSEFFSTAGIPIVAGRAYSDADRSDGPQVVVVSRTLARSEWPTETAVGKRIKLFGQWRTVVGVANDILTGRPSADAPEVIYVPLTQVVRGGVPSLVVRTRDDASDAVAGIRHAIHNVAPDVTVTGADEMEALVAASLADDRLRMVLISLFGILAVLLAAVGTYGVAATEASRRMREMAIRAAIGASNGSIARLIVGGAAAGVAFGALAGVGLALAGTRVLSPYLYGVGPVDPAAYGSVVALLAIVTVAATWLPARRATRVPLVETLRAE